MINVLIVDDSSFMRQMLSALISKDKELNVMDTAENGLEAVEKVKRLSPDVVMLDVIMPQSDGIKALEEIMRSKPTPVILVSSIAAATSEVVEEAYSLGVVDVVQKPQDPAAVSAIAEELRAKIKAASNIDRSRLLVRNISPLHKPAGFRRLRKADQLLLIGSSAGGPVGLYEILPKLPADFPYAVVVAQHIPHNFLIPFVDSMAKKCSFPVKIAEPGDLLAAGRVLFSPGNQTIVFARTRKGIAIDIPKTDFKLQPDIDMVFDSCAKIFGKKAITVVLSGMGSYGVTGAKAIRAAGGIIITEDKSTAPVYGMPKAIAIEGLSDYIMPSYAIAETVLEVINGKKPKDLERENFLVKGVLLKACMEYLSGTFGSAKVEQLIAALPAQWQVAARKGFSIHLFYPGSFFEIFYTKLSEIFISQDISIIEDLGGEEAKAFIAQFDLKLLMSSKLENLKQTLPQALTTVFNGVSVKLTEFEPAKKNISLLIRNDSRITGSFLRISGKRSAGWAKVFMKHIFKADAPAIGVRTGNDGDGAYIQLTINW